MTSFAAHLSPLALLLPALSGSMPTPPPSPALPTAPAPARAAPEQPPLPLGLQAGETPGALRVLEGARRPMPQHQVRIESRVIIRIAPSPEEQRERLLAALPRRPITTTYAEVEHGECVAIDTIAGVQPVEGKRLLLFLRDRRILSAALERACSSRSFYSGFYVERSEDGQLCVARDRLQSRSGASCQVDALHRLVAVRD